MKRIVQTLFLLAAFTFAHGQNFNPLRSNRIPFFKQDGENFILGLQVDSVTISGDSTFYHFYQTWDYQKADGFGYDEGECVFPNGPSWLGHNAVELSDGRFLFTNYLKDTITLKPYAEIDETWNAFTFLNGDILWATVDDIYNEEILGVESQLKEISFRRKDSDGLINPDFPSNLQVVISDSLGFVITFPFRSLGELDSNSWPQELWGNYELKLKNFSIIGLTNPNVGLNQISNISSYNFDVDDEFHWVEEIYFGLNPDYGVEPEDYTLKKTQQISKLIDKTYDENSMKITYTWDNVELYEFSGEENGVPFYNSEYSEYRSTSSIKTADTIYYLPEKAYYDEDEWEGIYYRQHIHSHDRMRIAHIVEQPSIFYNYDEEYWEILFLSGTDEYKEGLGEGLGDLGFRNAGFDHYHKRYLAYYKKGDQTWGTPLVINSVSTIHTGTVNVYPNPVRSGEYITISAPTDGEFYSVTLFNISGTTLKHEKGLQGQQLWQIPSQLPVGIYILRVTGTKGSLFTTRLSVQ